MRYEDSLFGSKSYIYLLLALAYPCMAWNISHLMPSHFLPLVAYRDIGEQLQFCFSFFRHAYHANPDGDKNYVRSSSYISMYFLRKLSNTSGNIIVSLCMYKWWYTLGFVLRNGSRHFCLFYVISIFNVLHCQIAVKFFIVWQWCFIKFLPFTMYLYE